jgi:hypothetical protein
MIVRGGLAGVHEAGEVVEQHQVTTGLAGERGARRTAGGA